MDHILRLSLAGISFIALASAAFTAHPKYSWLSARQTNSTNQAACQAIGQAVNTFYDGSTEYTSEATNFWNAKLASWKPSCVIRPQSTEDVAKTVQILNQFPDVKFAVKSAGHDPNPGHSSIQDGILVSLFDIKGVQLDAANGVAYVKPGGRWNDVIGPLDQQGYTVVGGRLGVVGVGGYLTGGGLSFLSAEYGMAADTIVGWELVTANGSIIDVTPESHPDLAVALRGSGLNFGIVTKFTMKAIPIGQVWGGYRIYVGDGFAEQIFNGLHEFISNANADPKAAIIVSSMHLPFQIKTYQIFYFYNGPTPNPAAFGSLYNVSATIDLTQTRSYSDLLQFTGTGADDVRLNTAFRSKTVPWVASDTSIYTDIDQAFKNITAPFQDSRLITLGTVTFQPFPTAIGKQSEAAGGNAMGLTANDGNRFIMELCWLYQEDMDTDTITQLGVQVTDYISQRIAEIQADTSIDAESYLPLFWNDATYNQDVAATYSQFDKFKALQRANDPNGLWNLRAGGFKYA